MILFAGIPSEPPLQCAIDSARRLGIDHVVLNQRDTDTTDLMVEIAARGVAGTLVIAGHRHDLADFRGIYARPVEPGVLPQFRGSRLHAPDPALLARAHVLGRLFDDWLDIAPARVANRPGAMASNGSKPFQAQAIVAAGLRTPETLVTNEPAAVVEFRRHSRIVYKSASGIRSIVREWTPESGPDLAAIAALPTQFQAFVPGENIRVHVVGPALFATLIRSDAIDYRYAGQDGQDIAMTAIDLPAAVADACMALSAKLDLPLAGIDLKRTPAGEWYCFEVNPAPAYSYFQENSDQPISDALVRYLDGQP